MLAQCKQTRGETVSLPCPGFQGGRCGSLSHRKCWRIPTPFLYSQADLEEWVEPSTQVVNHLWAADKLKAGFTPPRGNRDLRTGWPKTERDSLSRTIRWSCHDADRLQGKRCVLSRQLGHYVWQLRVLKFLGQSQFQTFFHLVKACIPIFAFGKCGHRIFQTLDQHIRLGDRTSYNDIDEYVSEK